MSGLTWARNETDDRSVSMNEFLSTFLKLKDQLEARHGRPLKAVKLSRLTLLAIPALPTQGANPMSTLFGVPVEIDDSLSLWEFREVHA